MFHMNKPRAGGHWTPLYDSMVGGPSKYGEGSQVLIYNNYWHHKTHEEEGKNQNTQIQIAYCVPVVDKETEKTVYRIAPHKEGAPSKTDGNQITLDEKDWIILPGSLSYVICFCTGNEPYIRLVHADATKVSLAGVHQNFF